MRPERTRWRDESSRRQRRATNQGTALGRRQGLSSQWERKGGRRGGVRGEELLEEFEKKIWKCWKKATKSRLFKEMLKKKKQLTARARANQNPRRKYEVEAANKTSSFGRRERDVQMSEGNKERRQGNSPGLVLV